MITPHKILVVVTQRIGDVLLATPLLRSIRLAWPLAQLEVLVFGGTEGVLQGNPDIDRIICVPQRLPLIRHLSLLASLWRKYDLALSLMAGDRPTLYAAIAGKRSLGFQVPGDRHKLKRKLLSEWVAFDGINTHTVLMNLKLAELLGIPKHYEVVPSWKPEDELQLEGLLPSTCEQRYVVLHVFPMYAYKMWHIDAWVELVQWLRQQELRVVLTGGNAPDERAYIATLLRKLPDDVINLAGRISLGGVACLLSRASAYVGPDTAVTHMAASAGIPTVALFGPTNPVKWGPWPKGHDSPVNPYHMQGTQFVGNVALLQGQGECVPCMEEGCERNQQSLSDCLQRLPASVVIAALLQLWSDRPVR